MNLNVVSTKLCSYVTYAQMSANVSAIQDLRSTGTASKLDFSSLYFVCCEVLLSSSSFDTFRSNIKSNYSFLDTTNKAVVNAMRAMQTQNGGRLMLKNVVPVIVVYSENLKTGIAIDTSYLNEQGRSVLASSPVRFGVSRPVGKKQA